jgi:hypothetical protein
MQKNQDEPVFFGSMDHGAWLIGGGGGLHPLFDNSNFPSVSSEKSQRNLLVGPGITYGSIAKALDEDLRGGSQIEINGSTECRNQDVMYRVSGSRNIF